MSAKSRVTEIDSRGYREGVELTRGEALRPQWLSCFQPSFFAFALILTGRVTGVDDVVLVLYVLNDGTNDLLSPVRGSVDRNEVNGSGRRGGHGSDGDVCAGEASGRARKTSEHGWKSNSKIGD